MINSEGPVPQEQTSDNAINRNICLWVQIVRIIYDISMNYFRGLQLEGKTQEHSERVAWPLQ